MNIMEMILQVSNHVKLLTLCTLEQVVYILDQVRALEAELLLRIKQQGLNIKPQILVVSYDAKEFPFSMSYLL